MAAGFGDLLDPQPEHCALSTLALHAWGHTQGDPLRLLFYDAIYTVPDWLDLVEALQALASAIHEKEPA